MSRIFPHSIFQMIHFLTQTVRHPVAHSKDISMGLKTSPKYSPTALIQIARAALTLMRENYDRPSTAVSNGHDDLRSSSVPTNKGIEMQLSSKLTFIKAQRERETTDTVASNGHEGLISSSVLIEETGTRLSSNFTYTKADRQNEKKCTETI
jgi:hypothetical protein